MDEQFHCDFHQNSSENFSKKVQLGDFDNGVEPEKESQSLLEIPEASFDPPLFLMKFL